MEARDEQVRIRPLPPEPPESTPPGGTEPPSQRRWLPLAVAAGLVVVFGVGVVQFDSDDVPGSGNGGPVGAAETATTTVPPLSGEAPTTTFTPPTTLPTTLGDRLPGVESALTVAYDDGRGSGVLTLWELADTEPTWFDLTGRPDTGAFDASGEWLAYLSFFGDVAALHVGSAAISQPAQFVGVTGAVWHPYDAARLAWVAQLPTHTVATLYEGTMDFETQELSATRAVAEVLPGETIVAWGDWGFVLERGFRLDSRFIDDPALVVEEPMPETADPDDSHYVVLTVLTVLDTEGQRVAVAPAEYLDSTAEGTLLLSSTIAAYEMAAERGDDLGSYGFAPDVLTLLPRGILVTDLALAPADVRTNGPLIPDRDHILTPDGERVIEVHTYNGTTITVYSLAGRGTRITNLEWNANLVGFSAGGEYLVLQADEGTKELIFVDWQSGRTIVIPIEWAIAAAVDLR